MPKTKGLEVTELSLDIATVCTNHVTRKQAIILKTRVGGNNRGMYLVFLGVEKELHPDENAPVMSYALPPQEFYGAALRTARAHCGWDWEPHPDKPEDMP